MCRKIYGSVYHNIVKDLDPEKSCHVLKRLTKIYRDITNGVIPDDVRSKIFNPNYQSYSVQLSKSVTSKISREALESWNISKGILGRSIAEDKCSDIILDNLKTLKYDKHIGRVLCPFMIDKSKDQKDSVMKDLMPLLLQVEHFNENGEIESVLDVINSLVKYPPVSEQIICLLVRSIEEFFYTTGYYPRISRDIGLVLLWEASREEKDVSTENGVTLFEENLKTVYSGGYFRTLMKNTDIDKPLKANAKIDQDVAIIEYYYKSLFSKNGLNVVYTIDGFDISEYKELMLCGFHKQNSETENESNEQEMEEKDMNKFNADQENKIFEEMTKFVKEMERGVSKDDSLIKNIAIIGGSVLAGAIVGWGIGRLFDGVFDTTEVVNDETFFKY